MKTRIHCILAQKYWHQSICHLHCEIVRLAAPHGSFIYNEELLRFGSKLTSKIKEASYITIEGRKYLDIPTYRKRCLCLWAMLKAGMRTYSKVEDSFDLVMELSQRKDTLKNIHKLTTTLFRSKRKKKGLIIQSKWGELAKRGYIDAGAIRYLDKRELEPGWYSVAKIERSEGLPPNYVIYPVPYPEDKKARKLLYNKSKIRGVTRLLYMKGAIKNGQDIESLHNSI